MVEVEIGTNLLRADGFGGRIRVKNGGREDIEGVVVRGSWFVVHGSKIQNVLFCLG